MNGGIRFHVANSEPLQPINQKVLSDLELIQGLTSAYGLVAVGGDLRPETLLHAYRSGVFPWYDESSPICWWSPDPRAIFELSTFRVSRRLERTCRSGHFHCTVNQAFAAVIRGCA